MSGIRVTIAKGHQGGQQTPEQGVAPKHLQFSQLTNYLTADGQREKGREMERGSGERRTRNNVCAGLGFALEVFCEQWDESDGILNMFLSKSNNY